MKKVLRIECNLLSVVWFIFYIQSCLLSLYFTDPDATNPDDPNPDATDPDQISSDPNHTNRRSVKI